MTKHGSGFKPWYVTLPVAIVATAFLADFLVENQAMMASEDNPFAAIGLLMVYSYYIGISLVVAVVAWILTIIFIVAGARK